MKINWIKCGNNVWCELMALDLSNGHFDGLEGVYILWHGGQHPGTVIVGHGPIRERLTAHKNDPAISKHQSNGLYVTWAALEEQFCPGVERYLFGRLGPETGTPSSSTSLAIEVNLPW